MVWIVNQESAMATVVGPLQSLRRSSMQLAAQLESVWHAQGDLILCKLYAGPKLARDFVALQLKSQVQADAAEVEVD